MIAFVEEPEYQYPTLGIGLILAFDKKAMPGQRFLNRKNIFHIEVILRVLTLIRHILPFEKNQFLLAILIVAKHLRCHT